MKSAIEDIARNFHAIWRGRGKAAGVFAECAVRALREADLASLKDTAALARWIQTDPDIPVQIAGENEYGEPTVTLYRDADIRIEVIFWMGTDAGGDGHDHKSPGAFAVVNGARLQNRYRYAAGERVAEGLERCELSTRTELLGEGHVESIDLLTDFIHSLFFLHRPSTSLSLRSQVSTPSPSTFWTPGLRVDRSHDTLVVKKARLAAVLGRATGSAFDEALLERAAAHPLTALQTLVACQEVECPPDVLERFAGTVLERHGEFGGLLLQVFENEARRQRLLRALNGAEGEQLRLFMGLLWSGADLSTARSLFAASAGAQPIDQIVRQCAERVVRSDADAFGGAWDESASAALGRLFREASPAGAAEADGLRRLGALPAFQGWVAGSGR